MKQNFSLKTKTNKIFPLTSRNKNEQISQSCIILFTVTLSQVAFHFSSVTYTSEIQTINS